MENFETPTDDSGIWYEVKNGFCSVIFDIRAKKSCSLAGVLPNNTFPKPNFAIRQTFPENIQTTGKVNSISVAEIAVAGSGNFCTWFCHEGSRYEGILTYPVAES